ncbi:MAG: lipoprotein-releasing system ATP-binding protein LolD 1 [Alphaproteobacteria bacterium]|nr:MAG: lipoprotein-releasing system ATP-binding protein LolD 1 [Alphaproteobacteria bacterium]
MNSTTKKAAGGVLLSLANVQRNYEQGGSVIEVLRDASLEVRGGEITALVGPSGSGKSTLLNIAGLLESPSGGEVTIDGIATSKLGSGKRGRLRGSHIGFVFQFHRLLPEFSALENVMIPQMLNGLGREESTERAEQLLAMVGLPAMRSPSGWGCRAANSKRCHRAGRPMRRVSFWPTSRPGNLDPETPPKC